MKIIKEFVPEISVLEKLLPLYKKLSNEINKTKISICNTNKAEVMRKRLLKINELNNRRASIAFDLLHILNSLYDNEKDTLGSLLENIIPEDIVNCIFFEEHQLYTLTKALDLGFKHNNKEGLNLNTDFQSENYSFHLKEYIILSIINNYTSLSNDLIPFITSTKDIDNLRDGCMKLYPKYLSDIALLNGTSEIFDNMNFDLNVLFSILEDDFKYEQNKPNENIREIRTNSKKQIITPPNGIFER